MRILSLSPWFGKPENGIIWPPMPITTIIFDIGNVILHFDYLRAARRFAEVTGLPLETIEKHFYFSELERLYSKGKLSSDGFFDALKRELGFTVDFDTFATIWNDIFWLNHSVEELIKALKGKYRLAAITNTTDLHFRYWLENFPVLRLIETFFPSHETGLRKPDPELFHLALKQLKARPEETVFVDDMEENAQAAQALGIRTVHYRSTEELKSEFEKLGIILESKKLHEGAR